MDMGVHPDTGDGGPGNVHGEVSHLWTHPRKGYLMRRVWQGRGVARGGVWQREGCGRGGVWQREGCGKGRGVARGGVGEDRRLKVWKHPMPPHTYATNVLCTQGVNCPSVMH